MDFDYLSRALDKMLATVVPSAELGPGDAASAAGSPHGLFNGLALEVFHITRALPPNVRESLAPALEGAALSLVQRGGVAEKAETVRALNQIRSLLRFAKDLGDITDEAHRSLESHMAKARRSVGLI